MFPRFRSHIGGFTIISAIFILVALAALAAAVVTISTGQQISGAVDHQGSRAYWAARSAAEWGLKQLLLRDETMTRTTTGTIAAATTALTVASDSGIAVGDQLLVLGAGAAGATLQTTAAAIALNIVTVNDAASTTVVAATVYNFPACMTVPQTVSLPGITGFTIEITNCRRDGPFTESGQTLYVYGITASATSGTLGSATYVEREVSVSASMCFNPAATLVDGTTADPWQRCN